MKRNLLILGLALVAVVIFGVRCGGGGGGGHHGRAVVGVPCEDPDDNDKGGDTDRDDRGDEPKPGVSLEAIEIESHEPCAMPAPNPHPSPKPGGDEGGR